MEQIEKIETKSNFVKKIRLIACKSIMLLIMAFWVVLGSSQESQEVHNRSRIALKSGYFGEFALHPGFISGIDYTLFKKRWLNVHWDSEVGTYFHKWNNNSVFIQTSIGSRLTTPSSLCLDVNLGIGYMLTSPDGDIYSADKNGNLNRRNRPLYSHLKPSLSILLGWNGNRRKNMPLIIQAGLETYLQSAFNHTLLPHAALRLGLIYRLQQK
jgi:hypothetical protein